LFAERKNVDKIMAFQIDEKGLPAKIHGSGKRKIRETRHTFISVEDEDKKAQKKGRYAQDD
jgi:hypothetical protein